MIHPSFTEEQERELIARMLAGDTEARNTLVLSCMNIYRTEAKKNYRRCRMDRLDLVSDLCLHVISICHKYVHVDGKRFHYFASRACRWRVWNLAKSAWCPQNRMPTDPDESYVPLDSIPCRRDRVDYREEFQSVRDCLALLTPAHRKTIKECFDFDTLEVANRREISDAYGFKNRSSYQYRVESAINQLKYYISIRNPYFPFSLNYYKKAPIPEKS